MSRAYINHLLGELSKELSEAYGKRVASGEIKISADVSLIDTTCINSQGKDGFIDISIVIKEVCKDEKSK